MLRICVKMIFIINYFIFLFVQSNKSIITTKKNIKLQLLVMGFKKHNIKSYECRKNSDGYSYK
jgi:hypothetical protein